MSLRGERNPDDPIERRAGDLPRVPDVGLLDNDHGDNKESSCQHGHLEQVLSPSRALCRCEVSEGQWGLLRTRA